MVCGWVHPSSEKYLKPIEIFSEELYNTSKIGGYKFGKSSSSSASFHFLSTKQLLSDPNLRSIDFKIRSKTSSDRPLLIFFLTTKQPAFKSTEPFMEPEVIELFDPNHPEEVLNLNKPIEKTVDLASPLTNEEGSPDQKKADADIEELLKKMDSNKDAPIYEEKLPQTLFEHEELTPVKEGEEEEIQSLDESKPIIPNNPNINLNNPNNNNNISNNPNINNNNPDFEFNDIIEELQKMKPEELKEFVASFEPDSRGKIALLLKDFTKEEPIAMKNEVGFEMPLGNNTSNPPNQGFYNPIFQPPQPQTQSQQPFYPNQNIGGYVQNPPGFNRPGKLYQPANPTTNPNMRPQQGNFNRFSGGKPQMFQGAYHPPM